MVAVLPVATVQTYERDGWGEFPTQIKPERREIRPTADRCAHTQAQRTRLQPFSRALAAPQRPSQTTLPQHWATS
jgi:hypothetical protein